MNNTRHNVVCPACGKILGSSPGAKGMLVMHMRSPGRKYRAAHRKWNETYGRVAIEQAIESQGCTRRLQFPTWKEKRLQIDGGACPEEGFSTASFKDSVTDPPPKEKPLR